MGRARAESSGGKGLKPLVYTSGPLTGPGWAWAILAGLIAYQAMMYGGVMRVYLHWSVVLMPWLLRQPGFRLYENAISQHAPGSMWLQMAIYPLIPDPILRVRLGMIVVAALCTGLLFWLARRWWGMPAGLIAAGLYAVWGPVIMDHLMYYEVLLGALIIAVLAVWRRSDTGDRWRPLAAGLLVGRGVVCKQQGVTVAAVFVIWRALGPKWRPALPDLALFLIGAALPVGLVMGLLAAQGRLDDALFWTWTFNARGAYVASTGRGVGGREALLLAGWLALAPLFAAYVIPRREQWGREGILLLGLLPALCTPAYPRYGRFHLSGAVPIVALIGAGALAYAWAVSRGRRDPLARLQQLYMAGGVALSVVALALPTYYRVRLGPLVGEVGPLVPLVAWLEEETGAGPGARVWMVPEYDATWNIYAIGDYQPPAYQTLGYSWFHAVPGVTAHILDAVQADPPAYAIVAEKWRHQVPTALLDYLEGYYTPIGQVEAPNDYGAFTFYRLAP